MKRNSAAAPTSVKSTADPVPTVATRRMDTPGPQTTTTAATAPAAQREAPAVLQNAPHEPPQPPSPAVLAAGSGAPRLPSERIFGSHQKHGPSGFDSGRLRRGGAASLHKPVDHDIFLVNEEEEKPSKRRLVSPEDDFTPQDDGDFGPPNPPSPVKIAAGGARKLHVMSDSFRLVPEGSEEPPSMHEAFLRAHNLPFLQSDQAFRRNGCRIVSVDNRLAELEAYVGGSKGRRGRR